MNRRLEVMICTCGDNGLEKVEAMHLPCVDGVGYIVSCQSAPRRLPAGLVRGDVSVAFTATRGLSANRNHALSLVTAPYALVADDDLQFYPDGLASVIDIFDNNPDVDIAALKCDYPFEKEYPPAGHNLAANHRGYYLTSFEIAVRVPAVRHARLEFSPLMGIGAPYLHAGEENVFVLSAIESGLKAKFFPVTVARHPDMPTGERDGARRGVLRAQGAYIVMAFGLTILPRIVLKAWRTPGCTVRNMWYIMQGAAYGLRHRKEIMHRHG